jgi:hypothetical protein
VDHAAAILEELPEAILQKGFEDGRFRRNAGSSFAESAA